MSVTMSATIIQDLYSDNSDGPSLRQVIDSSCKRIDLGAAVKPKLLLDRNDEVDPPDLSETTYASVLRHEMNAVVVEHHLKWAPLCQDLPGPIEQGQPSDRVGRYDFHHADIVVDWALRHDMKVKGHVLCWHVTTPSWVNDMTADQVREQLKRHIFTTMGHYRGRIMVWDVVNEALAPDGSLADNVFLRKLGPTYIELCFRWAHECDPSCKLLYNDNKVEGVGSTKADGFYQLLADLKHRGVPIHGCGMQAHFNGAGVGLSRCPTPRMVKEQIKRLGELGLSVNISEMDVRVSKLPPNLRQLAQKQIYHDILAAALTEPALDGIWLWGFTDRHTWVSDFYYDDEPLVFDEQYGRKEAYYSLRDALATMTIGGIVGGDVLMDSDVDEHGKRWGHLWMQPEPEVVEGATATGGGDSRPDWEQTSA